MVKTPGHVPAIILVLAAVLQRDPRAVVSPLPPGPLISLFRRQHVIIVVPTTLHLLRTIALQTSQFHLEAPDERQSRWHPLLVLVVLLAEEVQQRDLLHEDPIVEELPAGDGVDDEAHGIREDDLRADGPPEPPDVRRVPHQAVHPVGDQLVALVVFELNDVTEVFTSCYHG